MTQLSFYNTFSGKKEPFAPITPGKVGMYVCGPTVYNRPHIGNARSVVIYDVLFRLLRHVYGKDNVTYVRNITDVDDKINAAAIERKISIQQLTAEVTAQFHDDMDALNCLAPTIEPRATTHIAEMIAMIERLIANGNAYVAQGHVLFSVESSVSGHQSPEKNTGDWPLATGHYHYGMLSGRAVDDQEAGARIAVESYKKHPGDFVLWKPADAEDDASSKFDSPWGVGRPGWHIECSAMSTKYLGENFDIHGGGADLKFPHHENEIAQSCCANPGSHFAKTWVHNGFLTVNGEKMSKSLGNFVTVKELLDKGVKGEVIRLALLSAKYNEPLDWNEKLVSDAEKLLDKLYRHPREGGDPVNLDSGWIPASAGMTAFVVALADDLNTPKAFALLQQLPLGEQIIAARFLGLLQHDSIAWFKGEGSEDESITNQITARIAAKKSKNFAEADRIRDELKAQGILLEDRPDGTTDWRRA
jgi:cysteinyl-tRNA synthetase